MMKSILPKWFYGAIGTLFLLLNTVIWGVIVLLLGVTKWCIRVKFVSVLLHWAYHKWCLGNRIGLKLGGVQMHVKIPQSVSINGWYLLVSNHISWLDIVVLSAQAQLPAPKFFLKDELKYVPFIGTGAWALDMPFMKRASKAQIAKNPKLKRMDVERTRQSCKNFKQHPTTVINFAEGTRFTAAKQLRQASPFDNLLKPKAGGTAFALDVLSEQVDGLLNTAVVYHSDDEHICRAFFRGQLEAVSLEVDYIPIDDLPKGDYQLDKEYRVQFQAYMNQLWQQKSLQIKAIEQRLDDATGKYSTEAKSL
ncbi:MULTISPECIES: acetyltransferase [Pseudoalteromonas]|uniref:Acetyltransferase n=1 Tax=Pseudoalteromonas obscura TaxID=3048491 RepID=A0ABT7EU69_9GAMM|nr:acetyltransferase [Pseudoalteromonas sp. P94(2023)]MBQ4839954.1 1-acyl-sn-glycerol-3-phosphate acyltransferase [Pseudoalteromonas luteoviolacea]MDK2598594.1 acetyltransferase [Pseudoalteromonas sp. P94(2023)]